MHFPFMDLRRSSKIEVDTNLSWPKSFSISREVRFCYESTYFEQIFFYITYVCYRLDKELNELSIL